MAINNTCFTMKIVTILFMLHSYIWKIKGIGML